MGVRTYQKVVLLLSLTSITVSIAILSVLVMHLIRYHPMPEPLACVPADQVHKQDFRHRMLETVTQADGALLKCAYDSQQMSTLLELSMEHEQIVKEPIQPQFNISDFHLSSHSVQYPLIRNREPLAATHARCTTQRCMMPMTVNNTDSKQLDEVIGISQTGIHHVYSSIHFTPNKPCDEFKYWVWEHRVVKISSDYSEEEVLLRTFHSCCASCTKDESTSYTGGMFDLTKGELIQVQLSEDGLVTMDSAASFVGLISLDHQNTSP